MAATTASAPRTRVLLPDDPPVTNLSFSPRVFPRTSPLRATILRGGRRLGRGDLRESRVGPQGLGDIDPPVGPLVVLE